MSYTDFKEVTVDNPGTSIRYGGDDLKQLMQILNGKIVAQKRPRILNEWIWLDHFDIKPPAIVPGSPTDTNASRVYTDPTDFKIKVKKTSGTIRDIENIDIPDTALATITNRAKLPPAIAYEDEANTFTVTQTINRTSGVSDFEILQRWQISDDTLSKVELVNATSIDGLFSPWIRSFFRGASSTIPGLFFYSYIPTAQDSGTTPGFIFDSRKDDDTAITTRPLFDFRTGGTSVFKIKPASFDFTNKSLENATVSSSVTGITDASIAASGITTRSKLPTPLVYNDQANTFADFDQIFRSSRPKIRNPADTFSYILAASAITADRTVTLPLLTANDTLVAEAFAQTLTNKTINATNNTLSNIVDSAIGAHTSTKITITAKGQLNSAIMFEDEDNNIGDHYLDIGDIAVPANPSAGTTRLFLNSVTGELSVRKSAGTTISLETTAVTALDDIGNVVLPSPVTNDVVTWDGTNWVNAQPPGAAGGEANTGSNVGTAGVGIFKTKTGVDFKFKKVNAGSARVTITDDTGNDEVDIDIPATTVFNNQANTYGDFDQILRSSRLKIRNPADTFSYTIVAGAITANRNITIPVVTADDTFLILNAIQNIAGQKTFVDNTLALFNAAFTARYIFRHSAITANRDVTMPLLTANDIFVFQAFAQTLTNKTIDATTNTISNIADTHIAASGITTRSKLPAPIAYEDESNTFADLDQIFRSSRLIVRNPANTFSYLFAAAEIEANVTVNLPLLTADDTFIMAGFAQILTNKTIDALSNFITNITDGNIAASGITTRSKLPGPIAYEDETNTFTSAQTLSSHTDIKKIAAPANPALEDVRLSVEAIDANNNGLFLYIKEQGAIVKRRLFP